ncbi:unnamed protein product [Chrysodeixis includens]|uniref:Uncharacterized protein n=1 Tax=Chrysodeixis includens TaxID=689277 RepID=A0A9N8Q057_CHRIL|nr:unnamed protein product [Chrysodeixis includens]
MYSIIIGSTFGSTVDSWSFKDIDIHRTSFSSPYHRNITVIIETRAAVATEILMDCLKPGEDNGRDGLLLADPRHCISAPYYLPAITYYLSSTVSSRRPTLQAAHPRRSVERARDRDAAIRASAALLSPADDGDGDARPYQPPKRAISIV